MEQVGTPKRTDLARVEAKPMFVTGSRNSFTWQYVTRRQPEASVWYLANELWLASSDTCGQPTCIMQRTKVKAIGEPLGDASESTTALICAERSNRQRIVWRQSIRQGSRGSILDRSTLVLGAFLRESRPAQAATCYTRDRVLTSTIAHID